MTTATMLPVPPVTLTWLFRCDFVDGTAYYQTPEDRSQDKPWLSAYADLMTLLDTGRRKIHYFGVYDMHSPQHLIVDLITGRFICNGLPLVVPLPPDGTELTLWYTRTHRVSLGTDTMGRFVNGEAPLIYNVGWKADRDGRHYEQIMSVESAE